MKRLAALLIPLALLGCGEETLPVGTWVWRLTVQMWAVPNVEEIDANHKHSSLWATYEGCTEAARKALASNNENSRINVVCEPYLPGVVYAVNVNGYRK
jgi:hypothetical protein